MTERSDTEIFQVLVCQIAEDREIDIVISKALGVLGHPEFFEPIRNLLHGGPPTVSSCHDGVFNHRNRESIPIYPRYHASDGDFRRRFPSISGRTGIFASVDLCDPMGQHNAKLMLSTL